MTHGPQWQQAMQAYPRGAGAAAIAASIRAPFRRAHDRDEVSPEGPPSCLTLRTAPRAIAYFRHRLRNSVMDDISSHYLVLDSRR